MAIWWSLAIGGVSGKQKIGNLEVFRVMGRMSERVDVGEEAAVEEECGGGEGADHEEPCEDASGPAGAVIEAFGGIDDGCGYGAEEDEEEGDDDWGAAEEEDGRGEEDAEEAEEEEEETALVCFVVRGCGGVGWG
jgi:hypothetical protein